jgi:ketosteroid isomerase-like protein
LAISALLWLASPDPAAVPSPEPTIQLPPELGRILSDYEAAWRAGDSNALAQLFDQDGLVLSEGAPPVRGRAAIRQHYRGPGGPLVLRALTFATAGEVGYIVGAFARHVDRPDVGKFRLTLHRGPDGRWLIRSDMDNGNRPCH